ncbi:MAG: pyruvate ferredoxin oxidoreductase, partial [Syntrophus sp. (in: bacteria)]|nr:pyruvate ferredoxin oxidoreductase [Syntrophus sp. (in: bacteria)]
QMYCEDSQEVLDSTLQAFYLAEAVNLPVMVVLDAFYLSHTYEPVDVPGQEEVDRFLPPYVPKFQLDTARPCGFSPLVAPGDYMEMRYHIALAMDEALVRFGQVEDAFAAQFDRRYGPVEAIECADAEIIFVTSGTVTSTCRLALRDLRAKGEKAGILKIKLFRPFPGDRIREELKAAKKVAVIDRNFSFGAGGIFAQEVRAALCNTPDHAPVFSYIAGIGGRDVTPEMLTEIYRQTKNSDAPQAESVWMGIKEVKHAG